MQRIIESLSLAAREIKITQNSRTRTQGSALFDLHLATQLQEVLISFTTKQIAIKSAFEQSTTTSI